jgi:hypothetical protein
VGQRRENARAVHGGEDEDRDEDGELGEEQAAVRRPARPAMLSTCTIAFITPEPIRRSMVISAAREKRRAARTA